MGRIAGAFGKSAARPGGKSFIGFVTGGDPSIEQSEACIVEMIRSGADLVEIGIPFSDPIAEGPVIQGANIRALKAGAGVEKIFGLAGSVREKLRSLPGNYHDTPMVFLSYLNPVFRYGYDAFFARCAETGVDGIIIPDLPFEEQGELRRAAAPRGVDLISLVAPTSRERIRKIAQAASGFLYIVSSLGVTGIRDSIETDVKAIIDEVRNAGIGPERLPCAVGFGINTSAQAVEIAKFADGVIVGSAIVKIIDEHRDDPAPFVARYVGEMKAALNQALE
ncbi:MAG: tryptophan synthase subunit alpha [Spirochaetaceae bacterium]|jgi:tryptophan synthase alpha chain|nr:tryptophan synthase subunit alpha [Spirochaetaceae bacterium]